MHTRIRTDTHATKKTCKHKLSHMSQHLCASSSPTQGTHQGWDTYSGAYCVYEKDLFSGSFSALPPENRTIPVSVRAKDDHTSSTATTTTQGLDNSCNQEEDDIPAHKFFVGFGFCATRPWMLPGSRVVFRDTGTGAEATLTGMIAGQGARENEYAIGLCFDAPVSMRNVTSMFEAGLNFSEMEDEESMCAYLLKFPVYYSMTWGYMSPALRRCCLEERVQAPEPWLNKLKSFKDASRVAVTKAVPRDFLQYVQALACVDGLHNNGFCLQNSEDEAADVPKVCSLRSSSSSSMPSSKVVASSSLSLENATHQQYQMQGSRATRVTRPTLSRSRRLVDLTAAALNDESPATAGGPFRRHRAGKIAVSMYEPFGLDKSLVARYTSLPRGHRCIRMRRDRAFYVSSEDESHLISLAEGIVIGARHGVEDAHSKYMAGFRAACCLNPVSVPEYLNSYESFLRAECGAEVSRGV